MRKTMKFYVAGKFERRDFLSMIAERIVESGGDVVSTWLEIQDENINPFLHPEDLGSWAVYMKHNAINDLNDLDSADMIVADLQDAGWGTQFELGYAFAQGKSVALVGEKRTVFHWLPGFMHFETWDEFFNVILHQQTELNPPVKGKGI